MPDLKMPDLTVPAANADVLGEDVRTSGTSEGLTDEAGLEGTPRTRIQPGRGEARPGKDENQAGFLKERDTPSV